jgi:alpha-tubulin suppressor-like RCC1 family protein
MSLRLKLNGLRWLFSFFGALVAASFSWGYAYITTDAGLPLKWFKSSIPVAIKADNNLRLSDGSTRATSIQAAMTDVVRGWNHNLGALQFSPQIATVGEGMDGNGINEVFFSSTPYGYEWDSDTLAITTVWVSGGERVEADIIFNTASTWDSYRGALPSPLLANSKIDLQRVALHELGHMLGLDHPDESGQSVNAVMNSIISNIDSLQPDDIAGAQSLYGVPGVLPANDNFSNASAIIGGLSQNINATNIGATKETGEPDHGGNPGGHSVWWKWVATSSGAVSFSTAGSNFETLLAVYTGGSVSTLTVVAFSDGMSNGLAQPSSLIFDAVSGTTYYIAVDGRDGDRGSISLAMNFSQYTLPAISRQPESVTTYDGTQAVFSILGSGSPNPTYQWQRLPNGSDTWFNMTDSGGAINVTTATLALTVNLSMSGDQFRCLAINPAGSVSSNPATLTVLPLPLPVITSQPQSRTVFLNMAAGFAVVADRASSYQWYKNGVSLPGQTEQSIGFSNAQLSDAGTYSVVVSGGGGAVVSSNATLLVLPRSGIVSVLAAPDRVMFLRSDGSRWVAGSSFDFGINALANALLLPTAFIPAVTPAAGEVSVAVAALGNEHTLYVNTDEELWSQGSNSYGQLGDGTTTTAYTPVHVASGVVAAVAGWGTSLFIKSDGSLWGMGLNQTGQLGDGTTVNRSVPVLIAQRVCAAALNTQATFFIRPDHTLWATGSNFHGALGDGTEINRSTPVQVASDVVSVISGQGFSLFIKSDGSLWGTGDNSLGQLGDGTTTNRSTPILIASNVVHAAAGYSHSLFLKKDGSLWICGDTSVQFGDSDFTLRVTPVQVATNVVTMAAGTNCSYYLTTDGSLWATGNNQNGRLGVGMGDDVVAITPTLIPNETPGIPSPPVGVTTVQDILSHANRITWNPTIGATSYEIWRSTTNTPSSANRIASDVPIPLFFDLTAVMGTKYYYWIKAVNPAGVSSFSDPDAVSGTPAIAIQPSSQTAAYGSPVTFVVVASGAPDLTFQWRKNGMDITGATASFYSITHVTAGDAGEYSVAITNPVASVKSANATLVVSPVHSSKSLGDFDGDGRADLIWSNGTTGERSLWFLDGSGTKAGATLGVVPVEWVVSATADFDGDGKADIFWTNTVTGDRAIWLMNGSAMRTNTFMGTVPVDWVISGTGDFDGDGKKDLVWTNTTTGDRAMWLMNGSTVLGGGYLGTIPVEWIISGVGDFNGDGKADLIWSNIATGEHSMWFQHGSTTISGATLNTVPVAWVISGVGDFNGDGKADVFLSNTTTGDRVIWLMNGSTIVTNAFMGTVPVEWSVDGTGDFNGDGKKDLFWTNTSTGDRAMWLLDGATVTGGGFMGTVPTVWEISR